jgi:GT2 family glycosyltransferase
MICETISVIIPSESDSPDLNILKCIGAAHYPKDKIEVILAVGKQPSIQRNEAAKIAKGDILYFFNKDAMIEPDIFRKAADIINGDIRTAGAGGPDLTPPGNNYAQHLFGYAMSSYFAHWKMSARYSRLGALRASDEKELLLSNLAVRKDVFLKAGLFNERLYPNEENELINRIIKMGYKFIYSPELKIYRDRRKTPAEFAGQFHRYGRGRMEQVFLEKGSENPQFIALFFLPLCFLVIFFMNGFWVKFILLFLYMFLGMADAFRLSVRNKKNMVFILPGLYFIMHTAYYTGMWSAVLKKIPGLSFRGARRDEFKTIVLKALS